MDLEKTGKTLNTCGTSLTMIVVLLFLAACALAVAYVVLV